MRRTQQYLTIPTAYITRLRTLLMRFCGSVVKSRCRRENIAVGGALLVE